jgi:Ca2+-dependent lipid-binding protein
LLSQKIILYSTSDKSSDNSKSSNNSSKKLKKFTHFLSKSFKILLSISIFGTFDFVHIFFIRLSLPFVIHINILSYSSLSSLFTKSDEISFGSNFKSIDFIGNIDSMFI